MLLPGENVLQALRRLASVRQPGGVSGGGSPGAPASDALTRHPRALNKQVRVLRVFMLVPTVCDQGIC
jgi:hypothetical protein